MRCFFMMVGLLMRTRLFKLEAFINYDWMSVGIGKKGEG